MPWPMVKYKTGGTRPNVQAVAADPPWESARRVKHEAGIAYPDIPAGPVEAL